MKTFPTDKIRNVALVGHGGSGQDLPGRGPAVTAGAIPRLGRVEDGTTVCDFDPEEQRRRISVSLALAPFEHDGPQGQRARHARATPTSSATSPPRCRPPTSRCSWSPRSKASRCRPRSRGSMAEELGHPPRDLRQQARPRAGVVLAHARPAKERSAPASRRCNSRSARRPRFRGVVELLDRHGGHLRRRRHRPTEADPRRDGDEEHPVHDALVEGIVVGDDDLMERYLDGDDADRRGARARARRRRRDGDRCSRCCAAPRQLVGIDRLADFICEMGPSPVDRPPVEVRPATPTAEVTPDAGRAAGVRVQDDRRPLRRPREPVQGAAGNGEARRHAREQADRAPTSACTSSFMMRGKEQETVTEVAGRRHRRRRQAQPTPPPATCSAPEGHDRRGRADRAAARRCSRSRSRPGRKGDEDKLANALHRLQDEDPALRLERNAETHQTLLWGMGETHLVDRAREAAPQVRRRGRHRRRAGRPTARRSPHEAEAEGKYKKQTGGHGQFGVALLRVEPLERGARLRVRRRDRRRRDPPPVHPRGREGRRRDDGAAAACSASPSST